MKRGLGSGAFSIVYDAFLLLVHKREYSESF